MKNTLRSIKNGIKGRKLIASSSKENEFDQAVYGESQFKDRTTLVYDNYASVVFDHFKPVSFMDVGCANGFLVNALLNKGVDANGIEGADAAYKYMPEKVLPLVHKLDLRENWDEYFYSKIGRKFEVVNFTEVAEHLKPEHEDRMLKNIRMLVGSFLVMSWSAEWDEYRGTDKQEHFNPRSKKYVIEKMEAIGLDFRKTLTEAINQDLGKLRVYEHWKNNILVFKL